MPILAPSDDSVLLRDARTGRWLLFENPREILTAHSPEEVRTRLRAVEAAVETHGLYAAGFVSYEAAPACDAAFRVCPDPSDFPLLWFGLYEEPRVVSLPSLPDAPQPSESPWQPSVTPDGYAAAFDRVKQAIREGDSYQVNLTYRLRRAFPEDPWPCFLRMAAAQQASYGAYLALPDWTICCASPELFFSLDGRTLETRPMKGTAPRGLTNEQDRQKTDALLASEKERAENLMIVDMVRNDLGRVAVPGSVEVTELFTPEKYPTVWQLTSTVRAETRALVCDVFRALFPAASITGTPKARTTELIADCEKAPRRIYTGSIGYLAPDRNAQFNVAIRTLLLDRRRGTAEYGVGGGIVWDSDCAREQEECRTKARVLTARAPTFSLLETLRWTPEEGYALLDRHLTRLADSAFYFDIPLNRNSVAQRLLSFSGELPPSPHRVRLLVAQDGEISVESALLQETPAAPQPVALAPAPVDRLDAFLYHKTTRREVYEQAASASPGFADVILYNAEGEVTESTRANIVAEIDGVLCTPPVACGLLPGTFRAQLLADGEITERVITLDALSRSARIDLVNSVRGWMRVTLKPEKDLSVCG